MLAPMTHRPYKLRVTYTADGDAETLSFEHASARDQARKHLQQQPYVFGVEAWDELHSVAGLARDLVER